MEECRSEGGCHALHVRRHRRLLSHSPTLRGIAIYIDSNLGAGLRASTFLRSSTGGLPNIILATGYEPDTVDKPEWIKSIQGKEPPWS